MPRLLLAALLLLSACSVVESEFDGDVLDPSLTELGHYRLFSIAADHYGVPKDLLLAIAWQESSFAPEPHDTPHEALEHRPAYGWMGLTPERVSEAAALTGAPEDALMEARESNVLAGALLLDELRDQLAPGAEQLDARWWPVVVAWADLEEDWLADDYARDVFYTLQRGLEVAAPDGEAVRISGRRIDGLIDVPFTAPPVVEERDGVGYPGRARFVSSPNQSSRSGGIERIVLHTTEGSYNGSISWFRNSGSQVSSHYVIRKSDGEVTQMVGDDRKAWHACRNNDDTIGIEHEGASANPSTWTAAMLESSARLSAWLVQTYDIPIDRDHIVGHGEIQPAHCAGRTDPGPHFPWDAYLDQVATYAGAGPIEPPGELAFLAPANGAQVASPVPVAIQHPDSHVELWSGPALLVPYLFDHPAEHAAELGLGARDLTARAYRASGAHLATRSIAVQVVDELPAGDDDDAADDDDAVDPPDTTLYSTAEEMLGDQVVRFTAVAGDGVARVEYWIDDWQLPGQGLPPDYELVYTFNTPGNRHLDAKAFDADGTQTGTVSKDIFVPPMDPDPDPDPEPDPGCTDCVDAFPFTTSDDTTTGSSLFDAYACAPGTDESGPEIVYEVLVPEDGLLVASITDGAGVDVDVHILSALDADACVARGHTDAAASVTAGTWYVVVDSWVGGDGSVYSGAYDLTIGLVGADDYAAHGLDPVVFGDALTAFGAAFAADETDALVYTVIDFSLSSTTERLWTVDLADGQLLWALHVSHGENSGHPSQLDLASSFSNVSGSHQSSLGLARTAETYFGNWGYSLRLDGIDAPYNDLVRPRAIVIHGATYSRPEFAAANGYLGRSWGCPSVDDRLSSALIDDIKEGTLVFSWYPDGDWSNNSAWLQ